MSMKRDYQRMRVFTRTENERNLSSIYSDSISDEEPAPKKNRLVSSLILRGSNREASNSSVDAIIVKSGKAVPVNVREKNKCSKRKKDPKKSFSKSLGTMDDFAKFSESLIDELKLDYQKMLEQMKKNLGNLEEANSTLKTTENKGKRILNSSLAQEQKSTQSGM